MNSHHVFEVTHDNFEKEVLQSSLPVLVDFTADWCPPCKMLAPVVEELAEKYQAQLRVGSLNGDLYPEFTEIFDVYGFPTLILFQDGKPVERMVGFAPRHKIESKLTPHLNMVNVTLG